MSGTITRRYGIWKKGVYCEVELRVDMDALAHELVNKAAASRTGKTQMLYGLVVAEVVKKAEADND